jgi:hypothetical protein
VRGFPQDCAHGSFLAVGNPIEASRRCRSKCGLTIGAVAIDPFHQVDFLPRFFYQFAQESFFVFDWRHPFHLASQANRVKRAPHYTRNQLPPIAPLNDRIG